MTEENRLASIRPPHNAGENVVASGDRPYPGLSFNEAPA